MRIIGKTVTMQYILIDKLKLNIDRTLNNNHRLYFSFFPFPYIREY